MERKSFLVTELLCLFLGLLGAHRFYTGYIGLGILQLLTLGGCGIWSLIDFVMISLDKYKDANGQELMEYNQWLRAYFIVSCCNYIMHYFLGLF